MGLLANVLDKKMDRYNQCLRDGRLLEAYTIVKAICRDFEKEDLVDKLRDLEQEPSVHLLADTRFINLNNFYFHCFDSNLMLKVYPMSIIKTRIVEIKTRLEEIQTELAFAPYKKTENKELDNLLQKVSGDLANG